MLKVGQLTIVIYAIALFAGGLEGFIVKGSVPSLLGSAALAALLFYALRISQTRPKFGLGLGALLTLLSIGQFAPKFIRLHTMWPSGFYTILGALAGVIIGVAFLLERETSSLEISR